ncbi:MAG: AAA family ATPase [Desulfobacterales bacterium]
MRILRLDLIAFGPFTGGALDLSAGAEGLHIVYGGNEAGKSSALRAVRQLLYGIPERSKDDFVHPFSKLRIGGRLRSAKGEVLEVVRRKGRGATLRSVDDKTLVEESALARFLNGIDGGLFASMFGIGHEDLVAGGREIVAGGGEIGRLIFTAGSGVADLGAVAEGLQAEADALFRPSGQKQKINEAVGRLKLHRAELKEAQLPGLEWVRHEQALQDALSAKARKEAELAEARRRLSRLQRIKESHPVIAGRRETLKALASVAGAALLPDGFAERRGDALARLRIAQTGRDAAASNLAGVEKALSELPDPSGMLGHAEAVEGVHQDLGSQRKAAKDRIALETRCSTLRTEARQVLRSLRKDLALEDAETLRVGRQEAVRIQELGAEHERIATRIDETREKVRDLAQAHAAAAARLESLPKPRPVEELRRRLADADEKLPLEKQLAAVRVQAAELLQACGRSRARLGLTAAVWGDLARLPVPSPETLRLFDDRWEELERRLGQLSDEARKTEADLGEVDRRLDEARLAQEVPTEADLAAARAARDRAWRLIRRNLQGEDSGGSEAAEALAGFPGAATLPDAFEAGLRRSDEVADRLRREADRVAAKARLLADQAAFRTRLASLRAGIAAAQAEREAAVVEWAGVWQPLAVTPRSPREMRQWLSDFTALADKNSEALKREAEAAALAGEVDGDREALRLCLQAFAEPVEPAEALGALVRRTRRVIEKEDAVERQLQELSRERERLGRELESAKSRLAALEGDHRRWQGQWEQAVLPLGLNAGTRPAEASAVMEELKSFFDKLREAEVLQQRIEGIDRDTEAFRAKVAALAGAVAPDLAKRPAEEAAIELQRRLTAGREAQSRRQALQKQAVQEQSRLRKAVSDAAEIESLLRAMCAEAGVGSGDELPEAERRSNRRRELEAELKKEEERLLQLGSGSTVEEFTKEVGAVDPDAIGGDIEWLTEELERLTAEKSELDQKIGSERTEHGRMDGGDRAARVAEEIQAILGGLEQDVEHYARLKIAGRVLAMAMERFREKSQGPILKNASGFFSRITCGSFEGLRADQDGDGSPVLVGVRNGGKEIVPVEGMSDGTADQLYLALRLSGLEHYLDANEALPFIVDDILIKFDNERAAAALQALAEISKKTQVIFFTHHRHLPDMAQGILDPGLLVVHELGA